MNWLGLVAYFPYLVFGLVGLLIGVCLAFEEIKEYKNRRKNSKAGGKG